ncbi:hypothetical protein [Frigoribacterium sp. UYMn621]|uniref:hypothetical protein n=1 Tax=Frigoribacterium sp. UYMn621 TaxID=3156343 RepID=UPI003395E437
MSAAGDDAAQIAASIDIGIWAEQDWDGPSIKPGKLTDDEVQWLGAWLAGESFGKVPAKHRSETACRDAIRVVLRNHGVLVGVRDEWANELIRALAVAAK